MRKFFLTVVLCFSTFCATSQSGYNITINLKNCKDTIAYLTYYQFDKTFVKDTCTAIKNGKIIFKGKGKLQKGIYSLISQQKSIYFDFFIDDTTQKLEIKSEVGASVITHLTAVNSPRENEFFEYLKFITQQNKDFFDYKKGLKLQTKQDSLAVNEKQKELDERILEFEQKFALKQKGTYVGDVLNLKMEKVLRDVPKASNGRPDSLAVYRYYKKHYWDDVDFKDEAIIQNPFFFNKFKRYFESVVVIHPDSAIVEVDRMMDKPQFGSLTYKLMLAHLAYFYETSKIMSFDKVFVHIVDNYFKTGKAAGIYDDANAVAKIIKRADLMRPLLIGATAPDLSMIKTFDYDKVTKMGFETAKNSEEMTKTFYANYDEVSALFYKLYDVKADYLILVFWDVDCGHCQKEIPKLLEVYHELQKEKKDVQVYSVYTQHEGEKYLKYIKEKGLDWINVYDGAHFNNVNEKYDVYTTPVIYVLDKNKVIKAKRIGVEQVKDIIKEMERDYQKIK